ncbi:hypothetical protein GGF40_004048 [Coemansia sp. RSA 1286]|nr:hypothetical protein GGF40_004048 [Coemansia sp. RSA 1286]
MSYPGEQAQLDHQHTPFEYLDVQPQIDAYPAQASQESDPLLAITPSGENTNADQAAIATSFLDYSGEKNQPPDTVPQKMVDQFSHVEISPPEQLLGHDWRDRITGFSPDRPRLHLVLSTTPISEPDDDASSLSADDIVAPVVVQPKHVVMAWGLRLRRLGLVMSSNCADLIVREAGLEGGPAELQTVLGSMGLALVLNSTILSVSSSDTHDFSRVGGLAEATLADLVPLMQVLDHKIRKPGVSKPIDSEFALNEVFKYAKGHVAQPALPVSADPMIAVILAVALADVVEHVPTMQMLQDIGVRWNSLVVPEIHKRRSIRARGKEPASCQAGAPIKAPVDNHDSDAGVVEPVRKRARLTSMPSNQKQRPSGPKTAWCSSGGDVRDFFVGQSLLTEIDDEPSIGQIEQTPFVPLIFRAKAMLPTFWMVGANAKEGSSKANSKLDMTSDSFLLPIQANRWVAAQRMFWRDWCADNDGVESVEVSLHLQESGCQNTDYRQLMCRNCVTRQADQPCLNKDVRTLLQVIYQDQPEDFIRYIYAPTFTSVEPIELRLRSVDSRSLGVDSDGWMSFYCALRAAPLLLEQIQGLLQLAVDEPEIDGVEYQALPSVGCSSQPCIVRPPAPFNRQLCDACRGEVFGLYYACCCCLREICQTCFSQWDDSGVDHRFVKTPQEAADVPAINQCLTSLKQYRSKTLHLRRQHMRFIHWPVDDLKRVADHAQSIIRDAQSVGAVDAGGMRLIGDENTQFWRRIETMRESGSRAHAYKPWEMAPLYVNAGDLSLSDFSRLWDSGVVVVVRGLLAKLQADIWTPRYWISSLGDEEVTILNCKNKSEPVGNSKWLLKDFFRLFDGYDDVHQELFENTTATERAWNVRRSQVQNGILKIKDWPPTEDYQKRLPLHFQRFMEALPFSQYTHPDGKLNLAARLTADCLPPDLGPKMYCAYGSSDAAGGYGTTNLHCDMADAVNIMAYAAGNRADQAAAVWDIFPDANMSTVRKFVRLETETGRNSVDVIHDQETYLTHELREKMYMEYGDLSFAYRIHQYPGDAVFVPAGCAHQVCNYANAVKIAVDFVSPERVKHCQTLARQFQELRYPHPRCDDKLQLNGILWWAVAEKGEVKKEDLKKKKKPKTKSKTKTKLKSKTKSKSKKTKAGVKVKREDSDGSESDFSCWE